MNDTNINEDAKLFTCATCGSITQDEVLFLCNHCKQEDLLYKEGMYLCPACLKPGENFECMRCGSKDVKMAKL